MENPYNFGCEFCGRCNFSSQEALNKHQRFGLCAIRKSKAETHGTPTKSPMSLGSDANDAGPPLEDDSQLYLPDIPSPPRKPTVQFRQHREIPEEEVEAVVEEMRGQFQEAEYESSSDSSELQEKYEELARNLGLAADSSASASQSEISDTDSGASVQSNLLPDTTIRDQFREYCSNANQNFVEFTEDEVTTIKLLHLLKEKHTPMNAFEPLMLWHLIASKKLRNHQTLRDYSGAVP